MKKIDFKSLFVQNFLSVGNEPLEINFSNGLNVITGVNRDEDGIANGAGKSCVLDALYFAIFGNTMRELSKLSFIVNRKTNKNCIVKLEVEVEDFAGKNVYLIERKLAPQGLKLWKNGTEITKSTVAETNKYIEELIGANKDIFQNCILMRANNTVPFMGKKKQEKKSFIENIFNLNIFSLMSRYLKDDIRETKSQYNLEVNSLSLHENNIGSYTRELNNILESHKMAVAQHEDTLKKLNNKVAAETKKLHDAQEAVLQHKNNCPGNVDELQANVKLCNSTIAQLTPIKSKLLVDAGIMQRDLNNLNKSVDICPTCNRKYPDEYLNDIKNQKTRLSVELEELNIKISAISEKIYEIEEKKSQFSDGIYKVNSWISTLSILNGDVKRASDMIALYNDEIAAKSEIKAPSGVENFKNLINDTQKLIDEVKERVSALEKSLAKMNICEHILGEYGVRAYIVNKLLDLFNNRIMFYLKAIKSTFDFRFNEFFEEEIKDSNGVICLYNNCSGAEMKKIDLAISFAINDMLSLQKQIVYNILFFDEILDSSLDDKSLNIILNFISEHTQNENKSVYIISHKSGAQIPYINEVITLEKVNGFTKRIYN
jgi:DNA repair exonuclease SbcCD ATPase subunit